MAGPCFVHNAILTVLSNNVMQKIPVFRLTRPYLNVLVKPRIFSGFLEKYIILCILKGKMPFKMHKISFFPEKKIEKYVCLPYPN